MRLLSTCVAVIGALVGTSSATVSHREAVVASDAVVRDCGRFAVSSSIVGTQQRWRQRFGLACDQSSVRSALDGSHLIWQPQKGTDVAITADEQAQLALQEQVQQAMASRDLATFAATLPGFAGSYLDREAGGIATFLYTSDPQAAWDRLAQRFPYPDHFTVRRADASLATLTALQHRMAGDIPALARQGIHIVVLDLDLARSAVVIRVTDDPASVTTRLLARYGQHIRVEHGTGIVDQGMVPR
jgi:hypothetical protein